MHNYNNMYSIIKKKGMSGDIRFSRNNIIRFITTKDRSLEYVHNDYNVLMLFHPKE